MPRPTSPPEIRPATRADRASLIALLVAQFREHDIDTPPRAVGRAVDGILRHPQRGKFLVASVAGRVVALAALSFVWPLEHGARSAWLEELYVEPRHRGQGIGRTLLRAACALAAESGAVAVDLEVDAAHRRAGRLYAREGFRPLARARWVRALGPRGSTPASRRKG
jgi:GNAT superfamily N-acetyltransferase